MSSKPPSAPSPYSRYVAAPGILVEKTGTKGGSRDKPKAYNGHVVIEKVVHASPGWYQGNPYNDMDLLIDANGPWARIESRLHAKLQDILGDRAEIGTTLAEYRSGLDMLTQGARRLSTAALALKRGRFRDFLESINAKPLKKHQGWVRSSPKIASQLWIEYWFGWAPTINDIQTAMKILDSDPPVGSIPFEVATGAEWLLKQSSTMSQPLIDCQCKSFGKSGGKYTMVNPNLALAQRMGLLNPLTVALNVTPWSWLLGWFVNLNQYVNQLTAFAGYTFTDTYTTNHTLFKGRMRWQFSSSYGEYVTRGSRTRRFLRLPKVKLHLKKFNLSLTRAATAVSLLTMRLKSL